jgi:predicted metalloprotease with PDZ domain
LANVYEGGAAHQAGLSAGDILVAIDGLRVTHSNLDNLLGRYRAGDLVTVHAFRRDELFSVTAGVSKGDAPQMVLTPETKPAAVTRKRTQWLSMKS